MPLKDPTLKMRLYFSAFTFLKTLDFMAILMDSLTGLELKKNSFPVLLIARSPAMVKALLHACAGSTCAYYQLSIQPENIVCFPVFDLVIPA